MAENQEEILREGEYLASEFEKLVGKEAETNYVYKKLLGAFRRGGKYSAKVFCQNEFDKFGGLSPNMVVIRFLEKNVFDAGEDGLEEETPWNWSRRREAGKK